jgi:glycosyltransferase involved in cell wall biosynthesis
MNCFNGEKYLEQSIHSIILQSYDNWELIFWDNQSTDLSKDLLSQFSDERIKYYYSDRHTSLYEARNRAISHAKGEFISFLDVDDIWHPDKILTQIEYFIKYPDTEFLYTNYSIHNLSNNTNILAFSGYELNKCNANDLIRNYCIGILTVMMRKYIFCNLEFKFNPVYNIIGDFDLFVRLSLWIKVSSINLNLATYRVHGENEGIINKHKYFDEINYWCTEMALCYPNLSLRPILNKSIYGRACILLEDENFFDAFSLYRKLSFGMFKIKLLIRLIINIYQVKK